MTGEAAAPYPASMQPIRSILSEPRVVPAPPERVWRDWALMGLIAVVAIIEIAVRDDLVALPLAVLMLVVTAVALLYRRTAPLASFALVFGLVVASNVVMIVTDQPDFGLYTMAFLLILPYSLFRWGSGREAAIGFAMMLIVLGTAYLATPPADVGEVIGGVLVFFFPAELGGLIRYRTTARHRALEQARTDERERLARELHDAVAHHVSAIAIRAQAGQAVAATDPDATAGALAIIEREASATLREMRTMVGVLRSDDGAELRPPATVHDITRLSRDGTPRVEVDLDDSIDVGPAVGGALYRIAQEAVTNALRHARGVTRIDVAVTSGDGSVALTVTDDGHGSMSVAENGYGIRGMTERATLLGGSLTAGPRPGGGWTVAATLPRTPR